MGKLGNPLDTPSGSATLGGKERTMRVVKVDNNTKELRVYPDILTHDEYTAIETTKGESFLWTLVVNLTEPLKPIDTYQYFSKSIDLQGKFIHKKSYERVFLARLCTGQNGNIIRFVNNE